MLNKLLPLSAFLCLLLIQCNSDRSGRYAGTFEDISVTYPETFRDTLQIDTFFGKPVPDPYRWLEEDQAPATAAWVEAQNKTTFDYLKKIPFRESIRKRLEEVWNYERYSAPFKEGDYYYYFRNDGLQNQAALYRLLSLNGEPELVLDPNRFSEDGTTALGDYAFSADGSLMAFEISEGGSDWRSIRLMDLQSLEVKEERIDWVKFSQIAWAGNGFFYSRYPEPPEGAEGSGISEFQQVYYHEIGTSQSEDQLVFADRSRPWRGFSAQTTEDERYLVLSVWESTSGNALYLKDLNLPNSEFQPIVEEIEDDYEVVGDLDGMLYVRTNNKADNWRLVKISLRKPDRGYWEEILSEKEQPLRAAHLIGGKILGSYLKDAHSQLSIFTLEGKTLGNIDLPGIGTLGNIQGKSEDGRAFFEFDSYTRPPVIYELDMGTLTSKVFRAPTINFNSDQYITRQVWFKSKGGADIPMFLTFRKGLKMDGNRPTLLYGYGGFDIPVLPRFQVQRTILLENGGIFAVANIRGGGEFGKKWHEAGIKENKQNVFDDFQAAAEYLQREGYTRKEKLAIEGRSNGGLLVGACITQRPDLYQVAFPGVGVFDMLRYHQFTIGAAWATDYGRSDVEKEFDHLISYSPLHNAIPAEYPATLITTADHDDRVFPAHSFKFAAELQHQQRGPLPVLIRIETNAGHGAGKSTAKKIQENADLLSFMFYHFHEGVIYD